MYSLTKNNDIYKIIPNTKNRIVKNWIISSSKVQNYVQFVYVVLIK